MSANGQGGTTGQAGSGPPEASEVVEHLRKATMEIAAAGKAFLDMVEQALGDLFGGMAGGGAGGGAPGDKPRVERIDVEDQRPPESG